MSLRQGHFVNFAGEFRLYGLQNAGPDNLNLPSEKINELGNEKSIATVFDTPDLSWTAETFDFTTDLEAVLTRVDPSAVVDGTEFDFTNAKPLDIVSPWKGKYGTFITLNGVAVPYLLLENITYRAGVRQNASKQVTLRGDAVYYCQKTPYFKRFAAATVAGLGVGPYTFDHVGLPTDEQGDDVFAYCVTLHHTDGSWDRLRHGSDYTDNSSGFTLAVAPAATDTIDVVYAADTGQSLPDTDRPSLDEHPAALRSRDVDIVISDGNATPEYFTWKGVQSAEATWRVTLDPDEELGNPHYVDRDYDVPDVSGTVGLRPKDGGAFFSKIAQLQGVTSTTRTLNVGNFQPVELEIQFNHPDTGDRMETVYVPDARFSPPPVSPRVGQKTDFNFPYTSDSGTMLVYKGERP